MGKSRRGKKAFLQARNDQIIKPHSNFTVVESYKTMRTNLLFSLQHKEGCRKIMITSSLPREGKSTISANLSISLAQTGANVLLIDCDLRKSRVHRFFDLKNNPGLSNVLGGFIDISNVIQKTEYPNLFVIAAGITPPNPAELMGSQAMEKLLRDLEGAFNYIILDTPPVNIVSDALSLTKLVDGVVVVTRQGYSTHTELNKAINSLEFVDAKILGLVLNDAVQNKKSFGYRGYQYKYGYGYGYSYSSSSNE